jgi:hypothetical protein
MRIFLILSYCLCLAGVLIGCGGGGSTVTPSGHSVKITSPNGGETLLIGGNFQIKWTSKDVANVKIDISTDGGANYSQTLVASTPSDGVFDWNSIAAALASGNVKIRISEVGDPTIFDVSDGVFTIKQQGSAKFVTVTSPNGGESWFASSNQKITWTAHSDVTNVKIELSTDGGTNYSTVLTASIPNNGSFDWNAIDAALIGNSLRVRISDAADASIFDVSDANFTIAEVPAGKWIQVTSPNGGEDWYVGSTYSLTWSAHQDISNVKIELSVDGGLNFNIVLNASTPNDGSYDWTILDGALKGTGRRIRISDAADSSVSDFSDFNFTISDPPITKWITVASPNGGENWEAESNQVITWNSHYSINDVQIRISLDGGSSYPPGNTLVASTPNDGAYEWNNIPLSYVGSNNMIKIYDNADTTINDSSDNTFTISNPAPAKSITVTQPNGGETLKINGNYEIKWTSTGNISNVNIYWSDGASGSPQTIATNVSNSGSYNWAGTPGTPLSSLYIKVEDASDSSIWDQSDGGASLTYGSWTHWATNSGPPLGMYGQGVEALYSSNGNVYMVGTFEGSLQFPGAGAPIISQGQDGFIARLNIEGINESDGDLVWVTNFGGPGDQGVTAADVDDDGNIYMVGIFSGACEFPGGGKSSEGGLDMWVAKYDQNGNWVEDWFLGGADNDMLYGVTVDDKLYVTGRFDSPSIDMGQWSGDIISALDDTNNGIIAAYDKNTMAYLGARIIASSGADVYPGGIDAKGGHVFVTGGFTGTVDFDWNTGVADRTSNGAQDVFLSRFDFNLNHTRTMSWGGSSDDFGTDISLVDDDIGYITGSYNDSVSLTEYDWGTITAQGLADVFVAQFDTVPVPKFNWVKLMGSMEYDRSATVDHYGENVYVGGSFQGSMWFDPDGSGPGILTEGGYDGFIASFNSNDGSFNWARAVAGPGYDQVKGIAATPFNGSFLVTGSFQESVTFETGLCGGTPVYHAAGGEDPWICYYLSDGCL